VALLLLSLAIWVGSHVLRGHREAQPPTSSPAVGAADETAAVQATEAPAQPAPAAPARKTLLSSGTSSGESKPAHARQGSHRPEPPAQQQPLDASPAVVHAQIPAVSPSALRTIHGHIKVAVLVVVDRSGNVIDALLENPGPSTYFARQAKEAARRWQFAPADEQDTRQWLLRFEFTRAGATGHAIARS